MSKCHIVGNHMSRLKCTCMFLFSVTEIQNDIITPGIGQENNHNEQPTPRYSTTAQDLSPQQRYTVRGVGQGATS